MQGRWRLSFLGRFCAMDAGWIDQHFIEFLTRVGVSLLCGCMVGLERRATRQADRHADLRADLPGNGPVCAIGSRAVGS